MNDHINDGTRRPVVVVGASGRLGKALVGQLERSHKVIPLGRNELDLASPDSIDRVLNAIDYGHLFLTGALTAVDYCETHRDEAHAVNASAPGRIAMITSGKEAHMTYISTDMVFGGTKESPYLESDPPMPANVYGASKLAGEENVLGVSPGNLVARVSWVFGPARPAFPDWIIGKSCEERDLTLPGDKICCPSYTMDLVEWLEALVFGRESGPAAGVFHLCNPDPCSWRDWGQYCIDCAREAGMPVIADTIRGVPVDSVPAFVAKRARNTAMDTSRFTTTTGLRPRNWRDALREFVVQSPTLAKYRLGPQAP